MSLTKEDGAYLPQPILHGLMILGSILVLNKKYFKIVCFETSLVFSFIMGK